MKRFDVVIVGSGIAGLSYALKVGASGAQVGLITKKNRAESNTNYAQGGIAAVTSKTDDFELHVRDTLEAGDGLCNEEVVRRIVSAAPERIHELIDIGVGFTMLEDGRPSLGKEGGHSKRRILHVKDLTGAAIEAALLDAVAAMRNVEVFEHHIAIDLITREKIAAGGLSMASGPNRVLGLYALDARRRKVEPIAGRVIMLATGGIGQVYQYTTNPDIATGDGIAMAYRAGCEVRNMEFIQFHPTALYSPSGKRFLISEAVRGEGAVLRNANGDAFMERYHPLKDLAPRDVVARAIDREMKQSGSPHVFLDMTGHPEPELAERFPHIFNALKKEGINMAVEQIPVVPACHYLCGGVSTNLDGETSLPGLFASGEVACTGLHGANRLASNSLLEACVISHDAAEKTLEYLHTNGFEDITLPAWIDGNFRDPDERVVLSHNWDELRRTMWDYVGIVRTTKRLQRARTRIENLANEIDEYYWNFKVDRKLIELRNLISVAEMVVACALQRGESRGLHSTLDYPDKLPEPVDSQANLQLV